MIILLPYQHKNKSRCAQHTGSIATYYVLKAMLTLLCASDIAAEEGHLAVVERLIRYKGLKRATRDSFGSTPFLRAAKAKQKDIVRLLAPFRNVASLSEDALGASKGFNATIVDFGNFRHGNKVSKKSLFELLYEEDAKNQRKPAMTIIPDETTTEFRWIHLPANNMAVSTT